MNNFERTAFERLIERQLGGEPRKSLRVASLAQQGWDVASLTELAAAYARTPLAQRQFTVEFIDNPADPQLVFARQLADSSVSAAVDDGMSDHLRGMQLPSCPLPATNGSIVDLGSTRGKIVVYAFPRTSRPGMPDPVGWDLIPGTRGCTAQACAFRDHFRELRQLGIDRVFGLSTQRHDDQVETVTRLHLPFSLLSDHALKFTNGLNLPTFTVGQTVLLKRITLILVNGRVTKVFYPVFPAAENAPTVIAWLRGSEPARRDEEVR